MTSRRAPALALVLALAARPLAGQVVARTEPGLSTADPAWLAAWSPLAPLAELPRTLPAAPQLPGLLVAPAPRVGLLWTAGTPAALGVEVTDRWARLAVARTGESGDYRRPLDAEASGALRFEGVGWGPVGEQGVVVGRLVAGRLDLDAASPSDIALPYGSNPFVPTDTAVPTLRRVAIQIEGGIGWRFGPWTAGLTAGALVGDDHTVNSAFPRLVKRSVPGVAAGVSRALPFAPVRLAVYGRWMGGDETIVLPGQPAPGTVYVLDGYSEPDPRAITPSSPFFYRTDRSTWAGGFAAAGTLAGATWTLYGERARRTDKHVSARRLDAPTDRWHATGSSYGFGVQRAVPLCHLLVTADARLSRLEGDATRSDLPGIFFRATERVWSATSEVRYAPPTAPWVAAATFALLRESHLREDFIAETRTNLTTWTPGIGVEVARVFGANAVSIGYAISTYVPSGDIPDPATMGPFYQRLVAPEQSLYATKVQPSLATFTVRHTFASGTAAVLRARRESMGAGSAPLTGGTLPFTPTGSRTLWSVALGVVIGQ